MMPTTLSQIRAALKNKLSGVTDLTAYVSFPSNCALVPPCACPIPVRANYGDDFSGSWTVLFEIELLASAAENGYVTGDAEMEKFIAPSGTSSIKVALEADQSLGGLVDAVTVTGVRDMDQFHMHAPRGVAYIGATFDVEVMV